MFANIRATMLGVALAALPSMALFTTDKIVAYKVPNGSIKVDGKLDQAWATISNQTDGYKTLDFNNYDKIVLLGDIATKNADPRTLYNAPDGGAVSIMAAYDDNYLYFYFTVKEVDVFNGSSPICADETVWKADAIELFLDPGPWFTTPDDLAHWFKADANGMYFGTSQYSIQIDKPILPDDPRVFYADRTLNNAFQPRLAEWKSHQRFPPVNADDHVDSSYANPNNTKLVGVEMALNYKQETLNQPWFTFGPGPHYISWGYNDAGKQVSSSDCSGNPIKHCWAKNSVNYSRDQWVALTGSTKGWAPGDSVNYDPSHSFDGWGQLNLVATTVTPAAATPVCAVDPDCTSDIAIKGRAFAPMGFQHVGNSLILGKETGLLRIFTPAGKILHAVDLKQPKLDLAPLGLKPGMYFATINGKRFSWIN